MDLASCPEGALPCDDTPLVLDPLLLGLQALVAVALLVGCVLLWRAVRRRRAATVRRVRVSAGGDVVLEPLD